MMHLYSALLCIVALQSTRMMQRQPQHNGASALTTHQLQVERRESDRANQVHNNNITPEHRDNKEQVIRPETRQFICFCFI